ncbi:MAG TPA: EF-Tu/IF-2/RF-3 family GTPase [Burkholderiales bacterium]|nr:EF-Tu/IF-2/RF-3 family GTPase [Burkholderiales bacterium]
MATGKKTKGRTARSKTAKRKSAARSRLARAAAKAPRKKQARKRPRPRAAAPVKKTAAPAPAKPATGPGPGGAPKPPTPKPAPVAPEAAEDRVGVVTHYYSHLSVAVVRLESGSLRLGDTIHVKGHTSDFRQRVESMQIEHKPVSEVGPGQEFGLKVIEHAREHDVVYKVGQ